MLNRLASLWDLLAELACGRHYDPDGPRPLLQLRLVHYVHQHGQNKGCSLARPCLGNALQQQTELQGLGVHNAGVLADYRSGMYCLLTRE